MPRPLHATSNDADVPTKGIRALQLFALLALFFGQVVTAQPPEGPWVAFDASFVRTEPGMRRVVGWYHRAFDGSTREESNLDGPAVAVIFITNVQKKLQYVFENKVWTSYTMNLPPGGLRPDPVARNPRSFTPAKPIDGIEVVRFVNPQGIVQFQAPKLNYFAVRTERPSGGREAFSNIAVREQPTDLFEPPPGASVQSRPEVWRGPIWYPAGEKPSK
jgi:hypothetical protein